MTDRFDDAARRLAATGDTIGALDPATRMTRGRTLWLAARAAVAFGAASALGPLLADARADDYCYEQCWNAAKDRLQFELGAFTGKWLQDYWKTAFPLYRVTQLAIIGGFMVGSTGDFHDRTSRCHLANCGDPQKYPPSQPPQQPPGQPPAGACDGCTAYCTACDKVSTGFICCALPPKDDGSSPCCPA